MNFEASPAATYAHPVWLAALLAAGCEVSSDSERRPVHWQYGRDCALYANTSSDPVTIRPLDICLLPGMTLEVRWTPGSTAYDVLVYNDDTIM
jgi:hypothetical protein